MRYQQKHRKYRKRGKRRCLRLLLGGLFAVIFCISTYMLVKELIQAEKEKAAFAELSAIVAEAKEQETPQAQTLPPVEYAPEPIVIHVEAAAAELPATLIPTAAPTPIPASTSLPQYAPLYEQIEAAATELPATLIPTAAPTPTPAPTPLPQYAPLYEQNSDFFGWISIEGTLIDYPVMYSPDRPEYYIRRAFDGSDSNSGSLFIDGACPADGNYYLIYGHHMRNKTMFGQLPMYADKSFYEEHQTIRFDTLYEQREYQVIAAFYSRLYWKSETDVFRYYQYTDLTDEAVFNEYIEQVRAAAIYDTGFTATYGDELLTLSTCNHHTEDGRFVVVAKKKDR